MTETGPVVDIRDVQVIKDDRTFLVTDRFGNVPEGNTAALGLYHRDTRFLSGLDLVVEGDAAKMSDDAKLRRIADAYESKYGSDWHFAVRDGAFYGEGGEALVYEVAPSTAFGFGKGEFSQTRWRFERE